MDSDQLLQSLGVNLGLPNLRFDGNGCARIAIDGAPALNFERDDAGAMHLYSVLGLIPPEDREEIYSQLLKGNLFGASTASATLALDELHGEIVLCRTIISAQSSAPVFAALVESFVAAAEDWQARLTKAPASDTLPAPQAMAPRMMEHFLRG